MKTIRGILEIVKRFISQSDRYSISREAQLRFNIFLSREISSNNLTAKNNHSY